MIALALARPARLEDDAGRSWPLDARLGEGGFGVVFASRDAAGRPVALKLLHIDLVACDEQVARFAREIEAVSRIVHPGVPVIHAFGRARDGRPYFVMERLPGRDLHAILAEEGALSLADATTVLRGAAMGLDAAHQAGVIHRDVKASNVMWDRPSGRVALLDFGVAKLVDAGPGLTASRQVLGTPCVMAPEQLRGAPVDARADVYSLGMLALHLLAGRLPHQESSPTLAALIHRHSTGRPVSDLVSLPAPVAAVLDRARSVDPAARHPGALAFVDDLDQARGAS